MENINLPPDQFQLYQLLLKANREQTEELKTELQKTTNSLNKKLDKANKEIELLKEKNSELERKVRKNNSLIFGLQVTEEENILQKTLETLNDNLGCDIKNQDINNIYKLGKSQKAPVLIEFTSYLKKATLFKDTSKLKQLNDKGLSLTDDLSKEDREKIKLLRKHQKAARARNLEAKIRGLKLIVAGKSYTLEELEDKDQTENSSESEEEEEEEEVEEEEDESQENRKPSGASDTKNQSKEDNSSKKRERKRNKENSPISTRSNKKKK